MKNTRSPSPLVQLRSWPWSLDAHAGTAGRTGNDMKGHHVLAYLVLFRILNALACSTFFQPDEFFQSLEVAHRLVFGYGWQTWEWREGTALRSPLHALIFVLPYWLVKVMGLEQTSALVSCLRLSIRPNARSRPAKQDYFHQFDENP